MPLHTPLCELLGIDVPIALAGMGGASHPALAAAVSNAGGLGILGAASCGPDELRKWIAETRNLTDRPFGVDTLLPASVRRQPASAEGPSPADQVPELLEFARAFLEQEGLPSPVSGNAPRTRTRRELFSKNFFEEQMECVIEARVPVYASGLGDPGPWIDRLHDVGTVVMAVVGVVRHVSKVKASGVDVIVAQGHDAGGHNSPIGTLSLVPQVVDAAGETPVLAAGGIGDGRGVAAAMMLGAAGAWVGTAFLGTLEANLFDYQKRALVDGNEESTVISRSVTGKPARLVRNKWAQAWVDAGKEPLPMPFQSMISGPVMQAAIQAERADIYAGFAGQGMGMIHEIRPAAAVLEDLVKGAETALAGARERLG
ncbi:MAG: nitronate monooxygenase family protein [Myxococcota bacterium]|nr:nitronate monooxygenase family protein [Myxococcota bacterium]